MYRTQVTILKQPSPSTVAALDYLGVILFSYTFEFMLPGQNSGRMRARGVINKNRDDTVIQKWQGNKKRLVMQREH